MGGFGSSFGPQQPQRNHTEAAIQQVWDQYNPKLPACKFLVSIFAIKLTV
jgi:hypothetical protein